MKLFVIGLIVVIAGLGIWRAMAGRVDLKDPDAVATAFVKALKTENLKKASAYWVPEQAEAWVASSTKTMGAWQSGSYVRFFEAIPKNPSFTKVHNPQEPGERADDERGGD